MEVLWDGDKDPIRSHVRHRNYSNEKESSDPEQASFI